ncbi:hypothetical protein [Vibrio crassostreae]|uniref:hypothetical protein n=1 Tax=Vibrio crassostreae TaxID=246167 RepID=UPI001B30FCFC|nr:hypothetical protein [Vibrio crassostreae]
MDLLLIKSVAKATELAFALSAELGLKKSRTRELIARSLGYKSYNGFVADLKKAPVAFNRQSFTEMLRDEYNTLKRRPPASELKVNYPLDTLILTKDDVPTSGGYHVFKFRIYTEQATYYESEEMTPKDSSIFTDTVRLNEALIKHGLLDGNHNLPPIKPSKAHRMGKEYIRYSGIHQDELFFPDGSPNPEFYTALNKGYQFVTTNCKEFQSEDGSYDVSFGLCALFVKADNPHLELDSLDFDKIYSVGLENVGLRLNESFYMELLEVDFRHTTLPTTAREFVNNFCNVAPINQISGLPNVALQDLAIPEPRTVNRPFSPLLSKQIDYFIVMALKQCDARGYALGVNKGHQYKSHGIKHRTDRTTITASFYKGDYEFYDNFGDTVKSWLSNHSPTANLLQIFIEEEYIHLEYLDPCVVAARTTKDLHHLVTSLRALHNRLVDIADEMMLKGVKSGMRVPAPFSFDGCAVMRCQLGKGLSVVNTSFALPEDIESNKLNVFKLDDSGLVTGRDATIEQFVWSLVHEGAYSGEVSIHVGETNPTPIAATLAIYDRQGEHLGSFALDTLSGYSTQEYRLFYSSLQRSLDGGCTQKIAPLNGSTDSTEKLLAKRYSVLGSNSQGDAEQVNGLTPYVVIMDVAEGSAINLLGETWNREDSASLRSVFPCGGDQVRDELYCSPLLALDKRNYLEDVASCVNVLGLSSEINKASFSLFDKYLRSQSDEVSKTSAFYLGVVVIARGKLGYVNDASSFYEVNFGRGDIEFQGKVTALFDIDSRQTSNAWVDRLPEVASS